MIPPHQSAHSESIGGQGEERIGNLLPRALFRQKCHHSATNDELAPSELRTGKLPEFEVENSKKADSRKDSVRNQERERERERERKRERRIA